MCYFIYTLPECTEYYITDNNKHLQTPLLDMEAHYNHRMKRWEEMLGLWVTTFNTKLSLKLKWCIDLPFLILYILKCGCNIEKGAGWSKSVTSNSSLTSEKNPEIHCICYNMPHAIWLSFQLDKSNFSLKILLKTELHWLWVLIFTYFWHSERFDQIVMMK